MPGFAHTATGIPLRDALLANTIARTRCTSESEVVRAHESAAARPVLHGALNTSMLSCACRTSHS